MKKLIITSLLILFLLPSLSEARRDIDRDDLGDEIVEALYVPVLFYDLDNLVPDFGAPRDGGARRHEGQDFIAPLWAPIVSPTEAIVQSTGVWSGAGKYVITKNPGGETFHYYHLNTIEVKQGDKLDPGDIIGTNGNTGNAEPGAEHLHFEIRENKEPKDPFPRVTKEWSLQKQVSFLKDIFRDITHDDEYARILVDTYPEVFREAYKAGCDLPREIDEELEDQNIEAELASEQALRSVLGKIPVVVQTGLKTGDDGVLVSLLQLYLIYGSAGPARDRLALAGPTGYYGSITASAMREFQAAKDVPETGAYDARTRGEMMERVFVLNLKR
jgi:hypothetical protein